MCACLGVSSSAYYGWLSATPSKRAISNSALDMEIKSIFIEHGCKYGAPRITRELQAKGLPCSANRVARRMQSMKLKAKGKRKFKATTDSKHNLPIFDNLLNRDFTATAPNQKWVTDITYLSTREGWLYLCVYIDLYSRSVIGWSMNKRMTKALVCDALTMALWRRGFPKDVIVHSDRGSQYASKRYRHLLKAHDLHGSMSKKGDCWDNACAESFFGSLKVEHAYDFDYTTREEAKQSIFEYIELYYNKRRRHSAIGYNIPEEFELMNTNLFNQVVR